MVIAGVVLTFAHKAKEASEQPEAPSGWSAAPLKGPHLGLLCYHYAHPRGPVFQAFDETAEQGAREHPCPFALKFAGSLALRR